MIRTNIDAFRQIGDRRIHFKAKVMLILCVFSGSDEGSKWRLLYSLLHPTTKRLNRLIWDIVSSPAPESTQWRLDCLQLTQFTQLTQGGSKVRWSYQSTIVGGVCTELCNSDRNLRTTWFEKGDFKTGILKKKHWVDFYNYRMDVYTHFQHTFMFKQLEKWILHPMTPLRVTLKEGPKPYTEARISLRQATIQSKVHLKFNKVSNVFTDNTFIIVMISLVQRDHFTPKWIKKKSTWCGCRMISHSTKKGPYLSHLTDLEERDGESREVKQTALNRSCLTLISRYILQ